MLSPENLIIIALLLDAPSQDQPKGQIFKVIDQASINKMKMLIKLYIEHFDYSCFHFGYKEKEAHEIYNELVKLDKHISSKYKKRRQ